MIPTKCTFTGQRQSGEDFTLWQVSHTIYKNKNSTKNTEKTNNFFTVFFLWDFLYYIKGVVSCTYQYVRSSPLCLCPVNVDFLGIIPCFKVSVLIVLAKIQEFLLCALYAVQSIMKKIMVLF